LRVSGNTDHLLKYKNILPIYAIIINKGYATYYELINKYYYEEVIDLLEIILIDEHNEYMLNKLAESKNK
jgi:hypothetical protein